MTKSKLLQATLMDQMNLGDYKISVQCSRLPLPQTATPQILDFYAVFGRQIFNKHIHCRSIYLYILPLQVHFLSSTVIHSVIFTSHISASFRKSVTQRDSHVALRNHLVCWVHIAAYKMGHQSQQNCADGNSLFRSNRLSDCYLAILRFSSKYNLTTLSLF